MLTLSKVPYKLDINKHVCNFCLNGQMSRQVFSSSAHVYVKPLRQYVVMLGDHHQLYMEGYKYYV